jgi:hypothetical protein
MRLDQMQKGQAESRSELEGERDEDSRKGQKNQINEKKKG